MYTNKVNGDGMFKRDTFLPIDSGVIGAGYASPYNQSQLHDLKRASRNLQKNYNSNDQSLRLRNNANSED